MKPIGIQDVVIALSQVPNFSTSYDTFGNKWLMSNSHLQQFARIAIQNYLTAYKLEGKEAA
jgi:hypothetical protein